MNIFIAFANQDRDVRDRLLGHMNLVSARQGWQIWSAKEIKAGEKWDAEIQQRLFDSEVVILLLSTDFFNSKYITEIELPAIVAKHQSGTCQIIPVIVRMCHWKDTAFGDYAQLGDIQALPVGERPLVSRGHWDNDDQPYFETVQGIREAIKAFQAKKNEKTESHFVTTPDARKSGLEMVAVEGGTFMMGSPKSEADRSDDECQHQVTVKQFSIGKYEVTQADWRAIMGNNPSYFKNCDDCPVEQVSWDDVQEFLKKLNAKYPGKNYRLPIEAEREYAAKGGLKSKGYPYAGSNDLSSVGWYKDNADSKTHPVGGKSPNELGLYDMSGNVWELCQDIYQPYSCDSKNTTSGRFRVLRGGGWGNNAPGCRAADRLRSEPSGRYFYLGFRLVSVSFQ